MRNFRTLVFYRIESGTGDFPCLQALCADVLGGHCAVLIHDLDLLYVRVPLLGGLDVAVADLVAAHLALIANAAYSRHIETPPGF